ncbi:MAG: hypothetical protein MNPFHGCM_00102 [Gemmatimonadaceae bacterium]|nr:hypothetical protein [Gemmatimonadaceae bacterium]
MSQFTFLQREWAAVFEAASKAEGAVHADPRTACFYARRTLELAVSWAFKHDAALRLPYQDNLSALIHEPSLKQAASEAVFSKARVINTLAHRSVFQKYRAIFDYFDSLLVGLTATPRDEVDRNTYGLFDLEDGVPTDAYSLEEAVRDGYLVPPQAVSVPLRFQREGIRYDELSEEDKDQWDALEWDDEGNVPDRIEAEAVNRWLFNKDTVDKVLEHLMTRGQKVAGGDRLGKTIIFAKNQQHAEFIAERFDANYPHLKGAFARVITFKTEYAQSLIDDFSNKDKAPHIAISVDMLDTGIDIPEVVNLVFFKLVRSKTKFWQMLGRGTRLCQDLFGLGEDKKFFYLFDYCQNLEYFSQDIPGTDGYAAESLAKRLFDARLDLIAALDGRPNEALAAAVREATATYGDPRTDEEVRRAVADLLQREVAAMKLDNFIVRPHRRLVEKYAEPRHGWHWRQMPSRSYPTRLRGSLRNSIPRTRRQNASTCSF